MSTQDLRDDYAVASRMAERYLAHYDHTGEGLDALHDANAILAELDHELSLRE